MERQKKYEQELEEMRQRLEKRPLLFERVPGSSAKPSAQASNIDALRNAGLTEDEIHKLNQHSERS